ncbi:MAG: band 7 protein [Deltaproteobacteria bacterium]|nr:MAG: band 7 protein [Deltaproteobacteria bacterium]
MEEKTSNSQNGWIILPMVLVIFVLAIITFISAFASGNLFLIIIAAALLICGIFLAKGLFTLQPNEARVLVLFGKYTGTVKKEGFHWANPFSVHRGIKLESIQIHDKESKPEIPIKSKYKVSLRARNFETQVLKVNDHRGNPIEIGAVVVWRVRDTAKALFDVDNYKNYVQIQSETALRHLANSYPYDHSEDNSSKELTLRDNTESISAALKKELQERLSDAGVLVEEARLTHLAYSPEIASVMLRRQQAEAIISARQKIVHGAVSMVQMALSELSEKSVVTLNDEQKANMVGNLLVVLCGEAQAEPVINAGSISK